MSVTAIAKAEETIQEVPVCSDILMIHSCHLILSSREHDQNK